MTCVDKIQHAAAGAGIVILARGPWIDSSWRNHVWKRLTWAALLGVSYEVLQYFEHKASNQLGRRGFGFSPHDVVAGLAGAAAVELVIAAGNLIW
jgi:hypothetical protein